MPTADVLRPTTCQGSKTRTKPHPQRVWGWGLLRFSAVELPPTNEFYPGHPWLGKDQSRLLGWEGAGKKSQFVGKQPLRKRTQRSCPQSQLLEDLANEGSFFDAGARSHDLGTTRSG